MISGESLPTLPQLGAGSRWPRYPALENCEAGFERKRDHEQGKKVEARRVAKDQEALQKIKPGTFGLAREYV